MANEVSVTIMGRVGAEPTLHVAEGKKPYVRLPLATSTRIRRDGEWIDGPTQWYDLKAWDELAHNIAASLHKGTPVVVHGELKIEEYTNDAGILGRRMTVIVEAIGPNLRFVQAQTLKVRRSEEPGAGAIADGELAEGALADGASAGDSLIAEDADDHAWAPGEPALN